VLALSSVRVFSVVLASLSPVAAGDAFLAAGQSISKDAIEEALFLEVPDSEHITMLKDELRPMYESLPKNEQGQLESPTVRYALHRYFVHKYGWYVKGLDAQGSVPTNSSTEVMKGLAPSFIMDLFEKRSHGKGLQLDELAMFAATLSDLIFQEGLGSLQEVYQKLHYSGPVSEKQFDKAVRAYFSQLIIGQYATFDGEADLAALETYARDVLADYDSTMMWAGDLRKTRDYLDHHRRNPFKDEGITWERAADHVREMMQYYGDLTKTECSSLKEQLQTMEAPGTGRVLLSDFYSNKQLPYHESVAYLRNLGVLEEEGLQNPRLIMANYISSVGRCYPFSSYFSVCCHNACEDFMGSLENAVKAPHATPVRVMEVVSGLASDSKPAPWEIPHKLQDRLQEIAKQHDGQVPLHGRLFMQWMHHAFPQECAFPHISGTTSPVSQDEWLARHGDLETVLAPDSDIEAHAPQQAPGRHAGLDELPWAAVEELVAIDKPSLQTRSRSSRLMRAGMGLAAVVSFALALGRASRALFNGVNDDKDKMHLV